MMFKEQVSESWNKRFGSEPPADLDPIAPFLAHRSVRRFTDEAISTETMAGLVAAAQSAATSSNLQSWSAISVQNPEKRHAIAEACANQKQVETAAAFFVFLADLNRIHRYAVAHEIDPDGLDTAEMYTVAVIDAALAAERMVCAAEALGYGICYIGALRNHPDRVREILNLPEKTFGIFGLCIGRPAENARADIKPRLSQDQVWFEEEYPESLNSREYDQRAAEYFASHAMSTDEPWSKKSGRRVQTIGLSGREALLTFLHEQGLLKR
ncbi:MAG: nitroreductase family protein [Armatimonadetes bacterium]|nr:nitroreductase family protein [Armatimonadota bacterium]